MKHSTKRVQCLQETYVKKYHILIDENNTKIAMRMRLTKVKILKSSKLFYSVIPVYRYITRERSATLTSERPTARVAYYNIILRMIPINDENDHAKSVYV